MNKVFELKWNELYKCSITIEASSKEEAIQKAKNLNKNINLYFKTFVEDSNWDAIEIDEIKKEPPKEGWEKFWGGEANYDLAQDLEDFYEQKFGKSCVLWTEPPILIPTDSLDNRPSEYSTHGYTGEFEEWGIKMCKEAVANGKDSADEVYDYIVNSVDE